MKSKTIILSSINSHDPRAGRGILTLTSINSTLTAKLRLYNIDTLSPNTKLGIYYQNKVYSTTLSNKGGYYEGKILNNFDMNEDFYCAILNTNNSNQVIIAGGTYMGCYFDDNSVFEDSETNSHDEQTPNFDNSNNTEHTEDFDCDKCAHCKYKEFFYSQTQETDQDISNNAIVNNIQNQSSSIVQKETDNIFDKSAFSANVFDKNSKTDNNFDKSSLSDNNFDKSILSDNDFDKSSLSDNDFDKSTDNIFDKTTILDSKFDKSIDNDFDKTTIMDNDFDKNLETDNVFDKTTKETNAKSIINAIVPQFDYIFENYSPDEDLNKLIENGKFVKISESDEQYSIGAIYENEKIKYICYAVRKNYNEPIPNELGKFHQWLPLDVEDPLSEGYHIVFQDASDLKIIEV